MPTHEMFSTLRVPLKLRFELKRLAAEREQPMYQVLEDLVRHAKEERRETRGREKPHANSARATT